jgi:hypothetical protein
VGTASALWSVFVERENQLRTWARLRVEGGQRGVVADASVDVHGTYAEGSGVSAGLSDGAG